MPAIFTGVLIIYGPPASGKGTLAKALADHVKCVQYASGDDLRQVLAEDTDDARLLRLMLSQGLLAPEFIMEACIRRLIPRIAQQGRLVMDGYPRHAAQILMLDHGLRQRGIPWTHAVELECSLATSEARTRKRAAEQPGRTDDAVLPTRLQIYQGELPGMRAMLHQTGKQVVTVSAEQPKEQVFRQALQGLSAA